MSSTQATNLPSRSAPGTGHEPLVSVVIPCLNEAENIERCIALARQGLEAGGYRGEVIVVDNNSEDDSAELARKAGATVVHERRRGYGSAYLAGFATARGRYIVMADADLTYDFNEIPRFVRELEEGADFVVGDRMDNIHPGAMPWLHRYVGNPVLTSVLNLFYRTGVKDAHCGMRGLRRDILPRLDLRSTGMEFASEMVIRAAKEELEIRQFPIEYHPRGRGVEALELPRRLAPPALPAGPQPHAPVRHPRRRDGDARHADRADGAPPDQRARPRLGPPHDGRRVAADDRRHPGRGARALRARVRHVLHGGPRPLVRQDARPLPARARARCSAGSSSWPAS